jgi:hypothetical protein
VAATFQPCSAKYFAVSLPSPLLVPVMKTVYPDSPVLVEYESTPYCKTFGNIILAMIEWGKEHKKYITEES